MKPTHDRRAPLGGVLAAVVTYHPGADLADNLAALRGQFAEVLVIDNGSPDFAGVEAVALATGCRVIGNGANLGVAAALNRAARLAHDDGFSWLATFDQDSLVPAGALAALTGVYEEHPQNNRIAILAMCHRDRTTGADYQHGSDVLEQTTDWRTVRATITSGSLVRCEALDIVGPYDDRLFIDGVDHDFCLRCRRAGWLVVEGRRAVMDHSLGAVSLHRLFGRRIACTNHSASRRYYITRNTLALSARHFTVDPVWSIRGAAHLLDSSLCALIFEKDRGAKASAMFWGAFDFARRRFGPHARLPGVRASSD